MSSSGDMEQRLDHFTSHHTDVAAASLALPKYLEDPQALTAHPWCHQEGVFHLASGTSSFPILCWLFIPWGRRSIRVCASAPSQISDLARTVPWQRFSFFSCFPVFFAIGLFHWVMVITGAIWAGFSMLLRKQLAVWCLVVVCPATCPTPRMALTLPGHSMEGKTSLGLRGDCSALHKMVLSMVKCVPSMAGTVLTSTTVLPARKHLFCCLLTLLQWGLKL